MTTRNNHTDQGQGSYVKGASCSTNKKVRDLEERYGIVVPNYGKPNKRWEMALEMLDKLIY